MAEYIDIYGRVVVTDVRGRERETTVRNILEMNKGVYTAADVRPMVTCADCKHWDIDWVPNYAKENEHFCPIVALTTWCDWFCADGEKREES